MNKFDPFNPRLFHLDKFDPIRTILIHFGQVWSILDKFDQVWTSLIHFGQVCSNLDNFDPFWTSLIQFNGQKRTPGGKRTTTTTTTTTRPLLTASACRHRAGSWKWQKTNMVQDCVFWSNVLQERQILKGVITTYLVDQTSPSEMYFLPWRWTQNCPPYASFTWNKYMPFPEVLDFWDL